MTTVGACTLAVRGGEAASAVTDGVFAITACGAAVATATARGVDVFTISGAPHTSLAGMGSANGTTKLKKPPTKRKATDRAHVEGTTRWGRCGQLVAKDGFWMGCAVGEDDGACLRRGGAVGCS